MKTLKEEALAIATLVAVVLVGGLAFATMTMPFVFPFVLAGAVVLLSRFRKRSTRRDQAQTI